MAMGPKIITTSTPLAAATMLGLLAAAVYVVAEFAPGANLVQPAEIVVDRAPTPPPSTAPRTQLDVPFSPDAAPASPVLCADVADRIFEMFAALTEGDRVDARTRMIASDVRTYLWYNCPNAIHNGDWHTTAEILGVGLIYEALEPQSEVYAPTVRWDPRAVHLVDVAIGTFHVRSPAALCDAALRQTELGDNAFTPLVDDCLADFSPGVR